MKKNLKVLLLFVLIFMETLQLIVIIGLSSFFTGTKPFDGEIPEGEPYTYSVGGTEFEIKLEHKDVLKLRRFLDDFSLIAPTSRRIFHSTLRNTLNVYMPDGSKHSITFKGYKEIFGYKIGFLDYDGQEYLVDYWILKYGDDLCSPYREEYYIDFKLRN